MKNYVFGYMRVSTEARNLDRQLNTPKKIWRCEIYNEKIIGTRNLIELTGLKKSTFYKNLKMDTKEKRRTGWRKTDY